jgi:hypothetical protein
MDLVFEQGTDEVFFTIRGAQPLPMRHSPIAFSDVPAVVPPMPSVDDIDAVRPRDSTAPTITRS